MKTPARLRFLPFIVLTLALLAGCAAPTPKPPAANANESILATMVAATMSASSPTQVKSIPTKTPNPEASKVILAGPAAIVQPFEATLSELAAQDGLAVEKRETLAPSDLNPSVKVVVLAQLPANLDELLRAAPQTQFLGFPGANFPAQAPNLTTVSVSREHEAFLAGYLAELTSTDWRVAALLPSDSVQGDALADAFVNGGQYYCGRCVPMAPPTVLFPITGSLPTGSSPEQWKAMVDELQKKILEVVYLSPEANNPDLMAYIASQNLRMLGSFTPPAEARAQWIATLGADPAGSLRAVWPDLVAGKGGKNLAARITLSDVNEDWLSPGKQRVVEETIKLLEQGLISPVSVN